MSSDKKVKTLQGEVALVTGVGRRQGIGAAICRALAEHGADVFFTYWHRYDRELFPDSDQVDPQEFEHELTRLGISVASAEADLSRTSRAKQLLQEVANRLANPTVLINNACYDIEAPFAKLTSKSLDRHYAINVRAPIMLCKEFLQSSDAKSIINMTSGQSLGAMGEDKIAYTVTKASVEMLTQQLAPYLLARGVTINALDPGPTDTGWMDEALKVQLLHDSKRGRINLPTDTAQQVIMMLLDRKTTGQVVHAER